ncbi:MAG: hypothetical protein CVU46_11605 [Chloroflexi bacterium HGW-Chloroflexi-8]|nr:MAG: hypothetical protein CVU46_11605 [Chloroflexi bacterium HGW-Chloroflexi-8]
MIESTGENERGKQGPYGGGAERESKTISAGEDLKPGSLGMVLRGWRRGKRSIGGPFGKY